MTDSPRRVSESVTWPPKGVVRVHFDPAALRGRLLELLASLGGNPAAEERIAGVDCSDPDLVEAPAVPMSQPLADYLQGRRVATITSRDLAVTSINDPHCKPS